MSSVFLCAYWPFYIFFGKMSIQVFGPFFSWIICFFAVELFEFFIYLHIDTLSDIWFANIFSYSIGCFFHFDSFFFCADAFYCDVVPFVYFWFYVLYVWFWKQSLSWLMSRSFFPMFSSRSLMVLGLQSILSLFLWVV